MVYEVSGGNGIHIIVAMATICLVIYRKWNVVAPSGWLTAPPMTTHVGAPPSCIDITLFRPTRQNCASTPMPPQPPFHKTQESHPERLLSWKATPIEVGQDGSSPMLTLSSNLKHKDDIHSLYSHTVVKRDISMCRLISSTSSSIDTSVYTRWLHVWTRMIYIVSILGDFMYELPPRTLQLPPGSVRVCG